MNLNKIVGRGLDSEPAPLQAVSTVGVNTTIRSELLDDSLYDVVYAMSSKLSTLENSTLELGSDVATQSQNMQTAIDRLTATSTTTGSKVDSIGKFALASAVYQKVNNYVKY